MPATMPSAAVSDAPVHGEPPVGAGLRVAVVAGNYNYVMDGAARSLNILVSHLLRRGHDIIFAERDTRRVAVCHGADWRVAV